MPDYTINHDPPRPTGRHIVSAPAPTKGEQMAHVALQRTVKRAAETDMAKRAEEQASKALGLGLDFSKYTNAEIDTVEAAARAERRRRWLATVPENIKRRMDGRGDHGDSTTET